MTRLHKPDARTAPALLAEMAARYPEREALVADGWGLTYAMLESEVARCASAMRAAGIQHGDRVGILMGNRPEWLIGYFGAMRLGAIVVGLNTWATARELAYQLGHAGVRLLLLEPEFKGRDFFDLISEARLAGDGLSDLVRLVVVGGKARAGAERWETFLVDGAGSAPAGAPVAPDDIACLLYTSGSTALPKGVPLPHGGLIDNMWEIGERQHLTPDDRLWLAVSLFWSLACVNAVFAVMSHGGTIVLQHQFDAGEALRLIEAERCTVFYGTPNMALALWEHPEREAHDLSSLRTGVTIGTPEQVQRVADLGVPEICNVYGLTEAYGNSAVTDAALPLERRIQTVGQALNGVEIKVVDPETGAPKPAGEMGGICVRGNLMPGYWNDPERTAEVFDADGFLITGDLGFLDKDGYLYYCGRLKEMVKTGGINVAPAEVEAVLSSHPAVELAFVTGIPDERLDEALAAIIVLRPGQSVDAEALIAHGRETLAAYKVPRHYRFVSADALPLTTTGKLQRNRLGDLFE